MMLWTEEGLRRMGRDAPDVPPGRPLGELPPVPGGGPEPVPGRRPPEIVDYAAGPSEPEALVGSVCLAAYGLAAAIMLLWAWSPAVAQLAAALALVGGVAAIVKRR